MKSLVRLVSPLGLGSEFGFASSITKATVVLRTTLLLCKLRVGATMVGVFMLAFSGMAGAEDVTGFKGFRWGTDFSVINQAKDLRWFRVDGEIGEHLSKKDAEYDSNDELTVSYTYSFYDNKLVIGEIHFFDDHARYLSAVKLLETKLGKPTEVWEGNSPVYFLESTSIVCNSKVNNISFWSVQYLSNKVKREDEAKKAKKDMEFDRLFN